MINEPFVPERGTQNQKRANEVEKKMRTHKGEGRSNRRGTRVRPHLRGKEKSEGSGIESNKGKKRGGGRTFSKKLHIQETGSVEKTNECENLHSRYGKKKSGREDADEWGYQPTGIE